MSIFEVGGVPIERPEDIVPFLGKPDLHWKKGYSAYELAYAWMLAGGFPPSVRAALDNVPAFQGAGIVRAKFEATTDLRTCGRMSQTDLLVHARAADGDFVIGVEGKVDEPFGETVSVWLAKGGRRQARLAGLCDKLNLNPDEVGSLRYQLFHRSVAAIFEAQALGCRRAVMLVHSFSPTKRWLPEYRQFLAALGVAGDPDGRISDPVHRAGIDLRFGWVTDPIQP